MNNVDQKLLENLIQDSSFINWVKKSNRNDIQYWNTWIINNELKMNTIDLARSIVQGISFKDTVVPIYKVEQELNEVLYLIRNSSSKLKRKIQSYIPYGITAIIAVMFTLFSNKKVISNDSIVIHKTTYGEIIDLSLPDGTKVVLNGNSEIYYSKENSRDITLIGEAYFKVKPIPATKAKFWVTTNDLKVEVYGTQFHVNTRDEKTDVVLDEGSIQLVLENGVTKKMNPGEYVSFSKNTEVITHKKVDSNVPYSLWRNGTYIFNNSTLKKVMKNMEYTYGVKVNFQNKELEEKLISGGIPNQNLKICLAAIAKSADIRIVKSDNHIEITNN